MGIGLDIFVGWFRTEMVFMRFVFTAPEKGSMGVGRVEKDHPVYTMRAPPATMRFGLLKNRNNQTQTRPWAGAGSCTRTVGYWG